MNSTLRSTLFVSFLLCLLVMHTVFQNQALASDYLTDPTFDFTFDGNLSGLEGVPGDTTSSTFSIPIDIEAQVLPFTASSSQSTGAGDAEANYSIDISSDFVPAFDVLNLELDLGVTALVRASWANWSNSNADLEGTLISYLGVNEPCTAEYVLDMAWSYTNDVELHHNVLSIKGPLDASGDEQYGFVLDTSLELPANWGAQSDATLAEGCTLVPGVYKIELSSNVSALAARNSAGPNPGASTSSIDLQNDVSIAVTGTFGVDDCPPGFPCIADADIDGSSNIDLRDLELWYNTQIDVTADGVTNISDEAAMAYLLGLLMIDTDNNGMIDEFDAWLEIAASPDENTSAVVQLHGAHPNPFNPTTMLAFTLPQSDTVSLSIFDVKGKRITTLLNSEIREAGYHEVRWNGQHELGRAVPAGVYFYRLKTEHGHDSGRMLLLK